MRHVIHILISVIICGLYAMLLISKQTDPESFVMVSNLTSFFLIMGFIVEIRYNHFLRKEYFKAFSLTHFTLIVKRISMFYRKFYLWKLILIPPVILFFIEGLSVSDRLTLFAFSVFQNLFSVYLFITLYDFLVLKGFEKHITLLPAILAITLIYIRNSDNQAYFFFNPFGGLISLPILFPGLVFYLVPVAMFMLLFGFNKYYTHRYWANV